MTITTATRTYVVTWTSANDYDLQPNAPFSFWWPNQKRRPGWQPFDELAIHRPQLGGVRMLLEALTPARWDRDDSLWWTETRVIAVHDTGIPLADLGVAQGHQNGVQILHDPQQRQALHNANWTTWTDSSYDEWYDHLVKLG